MKKELKPKLNSIIQFLKQKYKAEVIIIVGSRVIGDYQPGSDWDIYIFTKKKEPKQTPKQFYDSLPNTLKNEDLDVYVNDFNIKKYPYKLWRNLRISEVVLDKNNFGKKLRQEALRRYKKGPKKWTKQHAQWRTIKAQRYMKKFKDLLKTKNYPELFLRISWYYDENLIEWWFAIRNEFRLRPQQAVPYIKKKDPEFYKQLKIITSDKKSYKEKVNAIKKCNKILFNKKEYKKLIK
jgi:predicted nucleotidyltransferase